jgi:hypothetical protein
MAPGPGESGAGVNLDHLRAYAALRKERDDARAERDEVKIRLGEALRRGDHYLEQLKAMCAIGNATIAREKP